MLLTSIILDIQYWFWTDVETTNIKSINVKIGFEKKSMLKYTIQHQFLQKMISYSKNYTKMQKIQKTTLVFNKIDVVLYLTTSILLKTNVMPRTMLVLTKIDVNIHYRISVLTKTNVV